MDAVVSLCEGMGDKKKLDEGDLSGVAMIICAFTCYYLIMLGFVYAGYCYCVYWCYSESKLQFQICFFSVGCNLSFFFMGW